MAMLRDLEAQQPLLARRPRHTARRGASLLFKIAQHNSVTLITCLIFALLSSSLPAFPPTLLPPDKPEAYIALHLALTLSGKRVCLQTTACIDTQIQAHLKDWYSALELDYIKALTKSEVLDSFFSAVLFNVFPILTGLCTLFFGPDINVLFTAIVMGFFSVAFSYIFEWNVHYLQVSWEARIERDKM